MSPLAIEWQKFHLLVTVKAYPEIGRKTGEGVCTAGITKDGRWLRIYPVNFRELPKEKQFTKWQWITFLATKSTTDRRIESYKVREDSIKLGETLDSVRNINERKQYLHKGLFESVESMLAEGKTLGAIQPREVLDLIVSPNSKQRSPEQKAVIRQQKLFSRPISELREKESEFSYKFFCADKSCTGHTLSIHDWEIHRSYERFKRIYKTKQLALEKLREKWLIEFFRKRKTYLIIGTTKQYNKPIIIGYLSLNRSTDLKEFQQSLFE